MEYRPEEIMHRIEVLERQGGEHQAAINDVTTSVQTIQETPVEAQQFAHQNFLRNGDADISRNNFLYLTDITGTPGVDADVSEECFGWYTSEPDTCVEAVGSIAAAGQTLEITTTDFVIGDEGLEIVVEGAGVGGIDLITEIDVFTDSTHVKLLDAAGTAVTAARVRWRLLTLTEDSTDEDDDTDPATNNTVKSADHTLYATTVNDPDWGKQDGWFRLGSDQWLCHPLKQNVVRPSLQYILSFIYKLANELEGADARIGVFAGIWDDSPGQKKFLEGEPPLLTAEAQGTLGATTREYFVVMYTNWGESIGTNVATVTDSAASLTNSNYVNLSWEQPAGIVRTEIYRNTGGTYVLLNNPYPQTSYKDKGATRSSEVGFPTVDRDRSRAYLATTRFNFATASASAWKLAQFNIPCPRGYDASQTTDQQWFVIGLTESVAVAESEASQVVAGAGTEDVIGTYTKRGTSGGKNYYNLFGEADSTSLYALVWTGANWRNTDGAGTIVYTSTDAVDYPHLVTTWTLGSGANPVPEVTEEQTDRAVYLDRLSLDDKFGIFTRSPWDFDAMRGITSQPQGGDIGPILEPPIGPGGTGHCPTFDMPILIEDAGQRYEVTAIALVDNEDIYKVVNKQGIAVSYTATVSPEPQVIHHLRAGDKELRASFDEPVETDEGYKLLRELHFNDTVLTQEGLASVESNLRQLKKRRTVRITLDGDEKGFFANSFSVHNEKQID
jgi:hypothetical protein